MAYKASKTINNNNTHCINIFTICLLNLSTVIFFSETHHRKTTNITKNTYISKQKVKYTCYLSKNNF